MEAGGQKPKSLGQGERWGLEGQEIERSGREPKYGGPRARGMENIGS